jgi:hypothetical protein
MSSRLVYVMQQSRPPAARAAQAEALHQLRRIRAAATDDCNLHDGLILRYPGGENEIVRKF